ncbi:26278_t:CDS:2 [Gigaspora rosea]|nr:26278_t:CDS:2 [Gigaspora rosea]
MSKRCGCPYLLKAVLRNCKWKEARHIVVRMLKAGAKPSMIYEAIRDKNRAPTVTRKDISNIGLRINFSEETASIEALIEE